MPPTPLPDGTLRSAAAVNAEIRALWTGPGTHPTLPLNAEQRARYQLLLAELQQVERGDVVKAA